MKRVLLVTICLMLASSSLSSQTDDKEVSPDEAVFELEVYRVLETERSRDDLRFCWGQYARCSHQPDKRVKAWPALKSARPWCGSIRFDHRAGKPESGRLFYFAVDESGGTGTGYDALYFDANEDLDLTNDSVVSVMKDPPARAKAMYEDEGMTFFNYVSVKFDRGPDLGMRPIQMMPALQVSDYQGVKHAILEFAPTLASRGRIRIGAREYDITLGHNCRVVGRFDRPETGILVYPVVGRRVLEKWWGARKVKGMRFVDGKWYSLLPSPDGKRITVRRYRGELGILEISAGERSVRARGAWGSLESEHVEVQVGRRYPEMVRQWKVPVGDYAPTYLGIEYGPLAFDVSPNDHLEGKPRGARGRKKVHGVKIRKDKPFVLDFSNEPEVIFASPAKERTFRPGSTVRVEAVLIDPVLNIKFSNLALTAPPTPKGSRAKEPARRPKDSKPGNRFASKHYPLDPTVVITDSSGKEVARGKMPFG
jgi:hypothetical protein